MKRMALILAGLLLGVQTAQAQPNGPCGDAPQWAYQQPDSFARLPRVQDKLVFTFAFMSAADVNRLCKAPKGTRYNGCQVTNPETGEHVIIVLRPRDFNDRAYLCVLGHEVMHSLGGTHD